MVFCRLIKDGMKDVPPTDYGWKDGKIETRGLYASGDFN